MKYMVFYRVEGFYVLVRGFDDKLIVNSINEGQPLLIRCASLPIQNLSPISEEIKNQISEIIDIRADQGHYCVRIDELNALCIIECNWFEILLLRAGKKIPIKDIQVALSEFRLLTRSTLIQALSEPNSDLRDWVSAYCDYVFYDCFSLWIYNSQTEVFTFIFGSENPSREYIRKSENRPINKILEEGYSVEFRRLEDSELVPYKDKGMKSLLRIRLDLGPHREPAALTLYSRFEDLSVFEEIIKDIKSLSEIKYLESLQGVERALEKTTEALMVKSNNTIEEYMKTLVIMICEQLQYEAASVFLLDQVTGSLNLIATYDEENHCDVVPSISYPSDLVCLTNSVRLDPNSITVVYDLEENDKNSHTYDEVTKSVATNWTGVPLAYKGEAVAVLRLKNKFRLDSAGVHSTVAPRPNDYFNLNTLTSIVENYIAYTFEYRELLRKLNIHNNFSRVFRHELRAPISTLISQPYLIKRMMERVLPESQFEIISKRLDDTETLIERLRFISHMYDLDKLIDSQKDEYKSVSLLGEVVLPVTKIFGHYYVKQYKSDIVVDHDSLRGKRIYGRIELLTMLLNALIDNAAKYQKNEEGPIKIFTHFEDRKNSISLFVENDGLEILESEVSLIFQNHSRGSVAKHHAIDGTGIGLWLCKKIVDSLAGEIRVDSRYNPVRFEVVLPKG